MSRRGAYGAFGGSQSGEADSASSMWGGRPWSRGADVDTASRAYSTRQALHTAIRPDPSCTHTTGGQLS